MATTAIGTLIPILRDRGELRTRFGTYLLAAGAVGEFGPILLVTLFLSTEPPAARGGDPGRLRRARGRGRRWSRCGVGRRGWPLFERTSRRAASSRSGSRWCWSSAWSASPAELGLDLLLGGFVAGMITRLALRGHEVAVFDSKLTAVGFGFFDPLLLRLQRHDVRPRGARSARGAMLKLLLFFGLFLVVRGAPALLLYRGVLDRRDRVALAFFSATELPLVVAITTLAVEDGHMQLSTAAGAGRRGDALDPRLPVPGGGGARSRRRAAAIAPALSEN